MDDLHKEDLNPEESLKKDIQINSEDFKVGYRQGYVDGMNAAADRILAKLKEINKPSTNNSK